MGRRRTPSTYYFIGKDNIPFHTIIWPAMLMGYGGLNLPTDVPANQYVTFKGEKASKSQGVGASVLSIPRALPARRAPLRARREPAGERPTPT